MHMVADSRRRTGLRQTMRSAMAVAWLPSESNKGASKSLSALERKSTRVLRESPSKTPKNGSQMVPGHIAIVGAIGEACGEASRVSVSGTPPILRGAPLLDIENRYRLVGIKKAPRAGCCGVRCWLEVCCGAGDVRFASLVWWFV